MKDNLKNYKDQSNEAIKSDPKFDNSGFDLSIITINPLPVVNVSLIGGKKHRETTVAGLICLWDRGATNRTTKRRHNKNYERKMRSDKVEYSTAVGLYFTTHDVKVPFCMTELSRSRIINHRFHVDNDKGE